MNRSKNKFVPKPTQKELEYEAYIEQVDAMLTAIDIMVQDINSMTAQISQMVCEERAKVKQLKK